MWTYFKSISKSKQKKDFVAVIISLAKVQEGTHDADAFWSINTIIANLRDVEVKGEVLSSFFKEECLSYLVEMKINGLWLLQKKHMSAYYL